MKTYVITITMDWRDFVTIGILAIQTVCLILNIKARKELERAEKDLDADLKCVERLQGHLQRTSVKKENDDTVK